MREPRCWSRSQWLLEAGRTLAALLASPAGCLRPARRYRGRRGWRSACRKLSRISRRIRLRPTAVRTCFAGAVMPSRACCEVRDGRYRSVNSRSADRCPSLNTTSKSAVRVSFRRSRETVRVTSASVALVRGSVRSSGAHGPWHAAASESGDRRGWPCGPEIRACGCV